MFRSNPIVLCFVRIGDVTYNLQTPSMPVRVPTSPLPLTSSTKHTLRWMMQKDLLDQDMFLLGHPGPLRRWLALMFCEITQREVEFLTLSRDTTDVDIKQRREIKGNNVMYVHQPAVSAAIHGHVLVLEGVEKAERNVLPIINNLLENREMRLEDGSFLMSPRRYDELLRDHSSEELTKMGLLRVSPRFRVIALGLPVPKYVGTPLDPPLRSRFQCRAIQNPSTEEIIEYLSQAHNKSVGADAKSNVSPKQIRTMLSVLEGIGEYSKMRVDQDKSSVVPALLSFTDVAAWSQHVHFFPSNPLGASLRVLYPWANNPTLAKDLLSKYDCGAAHSQNVYKLLSVDIPEGAGVGKATFSAPSSSFFRGASNVTVDVVVGGQSKRDDDDGNVFVETEEHSQTLSEMIQSHALGHHIVLIGGAGSGKTALTRRFASLLGYGNAVETQHMYSDMSTRDLLQRRVTKENGDTNWELTPLLRAAKYGRIAVLDGIDALPQGTLSTLQPLLTDRRITLLDGTRVIPHDQYVSLKERYKYTEEDMVAMKIFPVHPAFRVIATARPSLSTSNDKRNWMNADVAGVFAFHTCPVITTEMVGVMCATMFPHVSRSLTKQLLSLMSSLNAKHKDDTSIPVLTLRHLLRIHKKLEADPDCLHAALRSAFLVTLMPKHAVQVLEGIMRGVGITPSRSAADRHEKDCFETSFDEAGDMTVRVRNTDVSVLVSTSTYDAPTRALIPSIVYFANPQHTAVLVEMVRDYSLGFNMLLIGNQGVGKNKLVDRFLQMLQLPRQYIQLHRDTTIASLTLSPNIVNGQLVWEDSAMVQAVMYGHVLVVDEIDKAPVEVVQILKGLVEDKEMILGDGRKIVAHGAPVSSDERVIRIHPSFRMIALANRPGYPFLGNDFMKAFGDMLSCHAITNPDDESQLTVLSRYAPNVPRHALMMLSNAFAEVGKLVDQGVLTYPYSLRELANVVRHMNAFPQDGISVALMNVFNFDEFDDNTRDLLMQVFRSAGIPLHQAAHGHAKRLRNACAQERAYVRSEPLGTFVLEEPKNDTTSGPAAVVEHFGAEQLHPRGQNVLTLTSDRAAVVAREPAAADSLTFSEISAYLDVAASNDRVAWLCGAGEGRLVVGFDSHKVAVCEFDPTYRAASMHISTYRLGNPGKTHIRDVVHVDLESGANLAILHDESNVSIVNAQKLVGKTFALPADVAGDGSRMCAIPHMPNSVLVWRRNDNNSTAIGVLNLTEGECLVMRVPVLCTNVNFIHNADAAVPGILATVEGDDGLTIMCWKLVEGEQAAKLVKGRLPDATMAHSNANASPINCIFTPAAASMSSYLMYDTGAPVQLDGKLNVAFGLSYKPGEEGDAAQKTSRQLTCLNYNRIPVVFSASAVEVATLGSDSYRRIDVQGGVSENPKLRSYCSGDFLAVASHDGKRVTLLDINPQSVEAKYMSWKALYTAPAATQKDLEMNWSDSDKEASLNIRHGKEDPNNAPHVGGNQWAGGTGGTDTAGLGGRVGPYRLDKGHTIHQVPEHLKEAVPQHIKDEARRVGREALQKRLNEIGMTEKEDQMYRRAADSVKAEIQVLRSMLQGLRSKQGERVWLRNQTEGVLDDSKIVDGLTGEKGIFKRRADSPDSGFNKNKKKKMMFVLDASASMYRFNSYDGRLDREVETAILLMESLNGFDDTISYSIVAHSGDSEQIVLVDFDQPPKNKKDRLQVCQKLYAHSQYCWRGDNTVEAMKSAVDVITKGPEADSYTVFVVSDANLQQYGIRPSTLARIMKSDERVDVFCIFIASIGQQAASIQQALPHGHGFCCYTAAEVPQTLKRIFITQEALLGA
eukprot:PhM_4_TR17397/c0_g1_i1/m.85845